MKFKEIIQDALFWAGFIFGMAFATIMTAILMELTN